MQHFLAGHQQFHLCRVKYLLWSCSELHKGWQDIPSSLCPCVSKQGHTMPRTHSRSGFPFTPLKRGGGEKTLLKSLRAIHFCYCSLPLPPPPFILLEALSNTGKHILSVLQSTCTFMAAQHTFNPTTFPEYCYKTFFPHRHSSTCNSVIPAAGMQSPREALRFTWLALTTCGFLLAFNNIIPHSTLARVPIFSLISISVQPGHQSGGGADRLTNT